jgi:hypothetical protein
VGELVDLEWQARGRGDHGEVLAPALGEPQANRLDHLDGRVRGQADGEPPQRGGAEREAVLDQRDQLGVVEVVAELFEEWPQLGQFVVERLLDGRTVILKAPYRVGGRGDDDAPDHALDGEEPQDEHATDLLAAPHPWRLIRGTGK